MDAPRTRPQPLLPAVCSDLRAPRAPRRSFESLFPCHPYTSCEQSTPADPRGRVRFSAPPALPALLGHPGPLGPPGTCTLRRSDRWVRADRCDRCD
eukprot:gene20473-biopygen2577